LFERLVDIGIHIVTVWEFLDHIILAYSSFTAAKLRNFPETTNDFGEILYLGCKSEYSLATSGMQGQAL
jgi:hypothetical protein